MQPMKPRRLSAICALTALLLSVSLLSGCGSKAAQPAGGGREPQQAGEADGPDYSVYQLCDNYTGLTIRLGNDMEYGEADGLTMVYSSDECMMSALREDFADYEASGMDTAAFTLEDYAALIADANGMTEPFAPDGYGNLAATYTKTINGNNFFYYATVRKGSDAFWVVNLACLDSQRDVYLPLFELWGSSITVN